MQALLSFENAPPFAAPLRFFLTGPLFAALAGVLLLVEGGAAHVSRWSPAALAAVHLLTAGFMLQIMIGALIQVLPVVAGANLRHPLALARRVHLVLTLGTLALVGGFLSGYALSLLAGALLLGVGGADFLMGAWRALRDVASTSPTILGLKFALFGLFAVVGLGGLLASALALGWSLPLPVLTDLHAAWGLAGWAGVLLAAMACVVVPMFQLTPGYPAAPSWHFPRLIFALLLLWGLAVLFDLPLLQRCAQGGLALGGVAFAGLTWRLQRQRRRARPDTTLRYWQAGLAAAIPALFMLLAAAVSPALAENPAWSPLFAVLLIAGAYPALIAGMLYKIVPFLGWLHLQNLGQMKIAAPNMNQLLGDVAMRRQWLLFALAMGLMLAAAFWPAILARPAGLAFAAANLGLFANLWAALRRYRAAHAEIARRLLEMA